jgi:hypothetical protein
LPKRVKRGFYEENFTTQLEKEASNAKFSSPAKQNTLYSAALQNVDINKMIQTKMRTKFNMQISKTAHQTPLKDPATHSPQYCAC